MPGIPNIGFGWLIDEYKGYSRFYHTGSTRGFRSVIQRFPEEEFTILILTNRNDDVVDLADKLAVLYLIGQ